MTNRSPLQLPLIPLKRRCHAAFYVHLFLALAAGSLLCPQSSAGAPTFPIKPSADNRFLVDQNERPFLWVADTAWTLVKKLTPNDRDDYLDRRAAQGFTVIQFHAVTKEGGPVTTLDGLAPFNPIDDLAKPVEAYWQRVEDTIAACDKRGMVAAVSALWLRWGGSDQEGWRYALTDDKARGYGRYLGKRFASRKNVVWILGGDANPGERAYAIAELAEGIKTFAPHHLITVHNAAEHPSAAFFQNQKWLDINFAYTYSETYQQVFGEWHRPPPVKPLVLGESGYEEENNDGRAGAPYRIRRQIWGAALSGALGGQAYGHRDVWRFREGWRQALEAPGSKHFQVFARVFSGVQWQRLVPDAEHNAALEGVPSKPGRDWELLVAGGGSFDAENYASSAFARDRSAAMAYLPTPRPIKANLARIGWGQTGQDVLAWWIDPTSGERQLLPGAPFKHDTVQEWQPPQKNAEGDPDWVLLVELRDWRQDTQTK